MRLGTETGSLVNHIGTRSAQPAPVAGMPATICNWTDRDPATVSRVSASGKTLWVRRDNARRTDHNGFSESQSYEYTQDRYAPEECFRLTKRGWRRSGGSSGLILGRREKYWDPCF